MLSHEKLEVEAKEKYSKRLKEEMAKESPNIQEICFLKGVLQRIDEGKLFN